MVRFVRKLERRAGDSIQRADSFLKFRRYAVKAVSGGG